MRTFLHLLINTGVANVVTNFLWFALVFWVYLETHSVLATGFLGGAYMLLVAFSSMYFGSVVDRHRKLLVMRVSAWGSVASFLGGVIMFFTIPHDLLLNVAGPWFWVFSLVLLLGCLVELPRNLALSTTVTMLVEPGRHANANGLVGTVQGISFIATSVLSGLSVGLLGMGPTMLIALVGTAVPLIHLHLLRVAEPEIVRDPEFRAVDFRGGFRAIRAVPGLVALIIFTTFNNLSGGVFMALIDPYGLTLFPVEMWGLVLGISSVGISSVGMVIGGLIVARVGLGSNPVGMILLLVGIVGVVNTLFAIRELGWLLVVGIFLFMLLMPAIEAAEQTVIQCVVPFEKQGRVFGFAMTFEAGAAPITAFIVAPLAEFLVVPYMDAAVGAAQWGWLVGEGDARGLALIFVLTGVLSMLVPLAAAFTPSYRLLVRSFREAVPPVPVGSTGD